MARPVPGADVERRFAIRRFATVVLVAGDNNRVGGAQVRRPPSCIRSADGPVAVTDGDHALVTDGR